MGQGLKSILAAGLIALSATTAPAQDTPKVVAVNQALQFLADHLLDGAADVVFPVPAGVDPSFWRPSIADISMIQSSDLIVLNGAGFATWVDRVSLPRSRLVNTSARIKDQFIVTESITHSHGDGGEHSHEGLASYTWLDPDLAIAQADAIASAIVARGLANQADVEAQLSDLRQALTDLDAASQAALQDAKDVAMIATHPRYQYFARRYGLAITSLEWDAGAMPTDAELADLKALVTELDARILIWEASPPPKAIAAAEALGVKSVIFEPLASASDHDSFVKAISSAVSDLAQAVADSAD